MAKKKNFQQEFKQDFDNLVQKCKPVMDKTGQNLSKAVKAAEEDIGRMYRVAQNHMEIHWNNVQKEKVYHRIGKEVAALLIEEKIDVKELNKYKAQLKKLSAENEKIKKKISKISKGKKKTGTAKKKTAKKASSKKKKK